MELPFESTINTAIEKISDGVIAKMNMNEERRNREFAYQLKELEFYKSNYEKDLKDIFDYWFELVRVTHIKDNKKLTSQEMQKYNKKYSEMISVDKVSRYKMNTIKYGGTETCKILALQNKLSQPQYEDKPSMTELYMFCKILAVLKEEILGQKINPLDIIQTMVNDYDENEENMIDAEKYVNEIYKRVYL